MNDKQKVVFKQLQLAGLGVVVFVFGLLYQEKAISMVGIGILIFGLLRTYYIKKVIDKLDEWIIAHLFFVQNKKGDELALIIALNDAYF